MYRVVLSSQARKDRRLLKNAGLESKARSLLSLLADDPFATPPRYEALVGNLKGNYSRRINIQHRLVYSVLENTEGLTDETGTPYKGIVFVKRMWTHYE